MEFYQNIMFWQTFFIAIGAIAAIIVAFLAYKIGKKQIEISNFVELFIMSQQVTFKKIDSEERQVAWGILVENTSSYPVYLNSYILNGIKEDIGNTPIPNNPDSWYRIPITKDIQDEGKISLIIEFEDYTGKKYQAEGFGKYEETGWNVHQKKRVEIN